jgi:hypothetical protein
MAIGIGPPESWNEDPTGLQATTAPVEPAEAVLDGPLGQRVGGAGRCEHAVLTQQAEQPLVG